LPDFAEVFHRDVHFGLWTLTTVHKVWIKLFLKTTFGKVNHGREPVSWIQKTVISHRLHT